MAFLPAVNSRTRKFLGRCSVWFMLVIWTTRWRSLLAVRLVIRRHCLRRVDRRRGVFVTKLRREISALTLEWLRRWPIFRSAAGRTVSSALCMRRDGTRSSSTPRRRLWWSAGLRSTRGSSRVSFGQVEKFYDYSNCGSGHDRTGDRRSHEETHIV